MCICRRVYKTHHQPAVHQGGLGDGDGIECTFKLDQSLMEEADPESSRYASHAQRSFSSPFYLSCAARLSRPKSSLAFADVASRRKHCASRFRAKENASPARHTLPFFSHPRPLFYFSLPQEQQCAETTSESVAHSLLLRKHFFPCSRPRGSSLTFRQGISPEAARPGPVTRSAA